MDCLIQFFLLAVDKLEQMLGSYGPAQEPYVKNFPPEESPTGMLARSGSYHVKSRVTDDDKNVYIGTFAVCRLWLSSSSCSSVLTIRT